MRKKIISAFCFTAALAAGSALSAIPAYAGFEWVAPSDGSPYQPSASGTSAPPGTVISSAPAIDAPVIISAPVAATPASDSPSVVVISAPTPQTSVATSQPEAISPVVIAGATQPPPPVAPPPFPAHTASSSGFLIPPASARDSGKGDAAPATISVSASSGDDIVQGFASQIPLTLALRQVLPVGYSFSVDQGVSMDTLVSYKGGKPWRETVGAMLASVGLAGHEQGTMFSVSRLGAAAPAEMDKVAAAPSPPPAADAAPPKPALHPTFIPPQVAAAAVAPAADAAALDVVSPDGWSAARGDTLRKVLTDWCHHANVELQWQAEYDYPVEATAHFTGGFEDAVRGLLAGFDDARPQPIGELHANPTAGQKVLVVQARGNSYTN